MSAYVHALAAIGALAAYGLPILAAAALLAWMAGWLNRRANRWEFCDHMIPVAADVAAADAKLPTMPDPRNRRNDDE